MSLMERIKALFTPPRPDETKVAEVAEPEAEPEAEEQEPVAEPRPSIEVQRQVARSYDLREWARERRKLAEEVLEESLSRRLYIQSGGAYGNREDNDEPRT